MTNEKRALIESLAVEAERTRQHWFNLGLLNTAGRSAEERDQMTKDYAVAEATWLEASAKLRSAQQP